MANRGMARVYRLDAERVTGKGMSLLVPLEPAPDHKRTTGSRGRFVSGHDSALWKPHLVTTRRQAQVSSDADVEQSSSKLRNFRKVKLPHFHRRHHHVEGFLSTGAHGRTHLLDVREHLNQALIEAEIANPANYFAIFH
jgi:hypothetical protein